MKRYLLSMSTQLNWLSSGAILSLRGASFCLGSPFPQSPWENTVSFVDEVIQICTGPTLGSIIGEEWDVLVR